MNYQRKTLRKFSLSNHRKDSLGHKYYLSEKIVFDLVSRLQVNKDLNIKDEVQDKLEIQEKIEEEKVE